MPITWITFLVGTLSLVGTPFFSGFYSKEHIIEAAGAANVWGATFAHYATLIGVFVTSLYSFRVYFLVFHGKERFDTHGHGHDHHGNDDHGHHGGTPHESPWVVTLPLVVLAIPSVVIGYLVIDPLLFGGYFKGAITVLAAHPAMHELAADWHGRVAYGLHAFTTLPFALMAFAASAPGCGRVATAALSMGSSSVARHAWWEPSPQSVGACSPVTSITMLSR